MEDEGGQCSRSRMVPEGRNTYAPWLVVGS
jgi:hypothetical protein